PHGALLSRNMSLSTRVSLGSARSLFTVFFFTDPATTAIYTLSLHDALPIYAFPSQHRLQPPPFILIDFDRRTLEFALGVLHSRCRASPLCRAGDQAVDDLPLHEGEEEYGGQAYDRSRRHHAAPPGLLRGDEIDQAY